MKIIYASLGLAVFFLIVNGEIPTVKDKFVHYYQAWCTDAKEEDIKLFKEHLKKCDQEIVKLEKIGDEVNDDKNNRVKLFKKFCKLYPELYDCAQDALNMVKTCLVADELKLITIGSELQKFMCSEDGKQGAVFIAEDGFDCLNKTNNNIETCITESVGHSTSDSELSFCKDLEKIKKCVKTNLETCSSESHAAAFEAFSKIVKEKQQCVN